MLLVDKGFKVNSLTEDEKGKVMYLMHHEGEGNGPLFIKNKMLDMGHRGFDSASDKLKSIFIMQVGKKNAEDRIEDEGGAVDDAYRAWLGGYIDNKIDVRSYYAKNPPKKTDELLKIVGKL